MKLKEKEHLNISEICFPNGDRVSEKENQNLYIQNEYHGEYDMNWIIVERNGQEIQRHNAKFVETIIWKEAAGLK